MRIKQLFYDNWGIARAIIEGDRGIEYNTSLDLEEPYVDSWCSCEYNVYKSIPCKHINLLIKSVERSKMVNKKNDMSKIPTDCKLIDELLGGGVPLKLVTALVGEPMTGKSWLSYQTGVNTIKTLDKEVLLIDTEGLNQIDLNAILMKLGKRFDLDEGKLSSKFRMVKTYDNKQLQSIQKLMMMFGYLPEFELSDKGGKYKVIFRTYEEEGILTDKELKNIGLIIIDSLTKPVKDSVGSENANLPARAQIIERLFGKLYQIAELYGIAIVVLHHASINPQTVGYKDSGHAYGGNPIYYNSKYILQLFNGTKAEKELPTKENEKEQWGIEARRIQLIRRPDEQATGKKVPVRLKKDWGFIDE